MCAFHYHGFGHKQDSRKKCTGEFYTVIEVILSTCMYRWILCNKFYDSFYNEVHEIVFCCIGLHVSQLQVVISDNKPKILSAEYSLNGFDHCYQLGEKQYK